MKIAVNTRLLRSERMTGIELFTLETMSRIAKAHPEHTFYYLFDRPYNSKFITSDNIVPVVIKPKSYYRAFHLKFWFEYILPKALKKINPDLLISPDSMMSLSSDVPAFIVIHDINFEHYPKHLPRGISRFLRKYTPQYVHKAQRIATVSEFSKSDLISQYNTDPDKIDVVWNGANVNYKPLSAEEKQAVRNQFTSGIPYFLFIGTILPRKNLANQLKAYGIFREKSQKMQKFLIVGDKWIWDKELQKAWESCPYKEDVIFVGRLDSDTLGKVISAATALMYVSLFEGFGIPILEAFYAGTPVITANVTSMPEVAGDAALCVDPLQPEEIAEAMKKIEEDKTLRTKLIEAGTIRKNEFSWDKTAELLWNSIEKVLDSIKK